MPMLPARLADRPWRSKRLEAEQEIEERLGLAPAAAPRVLALGLGDLLGRRRLLGLDLAQLKFVGDAVGACHRQLAVVPGPLRLLLALTLHLHGHYRVRLQIDDCRM